MLQRLTLKNKLTLIITLVTTVTLMFGFAGITFSYYNENKSSLIEGLEKEAKLIASYSQVHVALNFNDELKTILEDVLIPGAHTSAVCDFDPQQVIQVDAGGGEITDTSVCKSSESVWGNQWLWVTQPVLDVSGEEIGAVVFKVSLEAFYSGVRTFVYWALVFTLLSIAFSYALAKRLQSYISKPILDLEAATNQVCKAENYDFRVPVKSQDEIGSLSHSFNQMLEAMEQRLVERNNAIKEMHVLANYDSLTRLPNRALCLDRLTQAIAKVGRGDNKVALMFIDLDNFKDVNDYLGHNAGDILLIEVSKSLSSALREGDTLARLGGDEFVIILTDFESKTDLANVADKCISAIAKEFSIMENSITASASIGIAVFPDDAATSVELLKAADSAMYQAKERGKNAYYFYEERINAIVARKHTVSNALRFALRKNQLHVEYQPVVNLCSDKIVGAEALIRWNHPELGKISPAEFIPIAESTGLIFPVSIFVIESVCRFISKYRHKLDDDFSVALNLSPAILKQNFLLDKIKMYLNQYQIPAKYICFEVTENTLMNEMERCIQTLNALKQLGSKVSIDDFGTGYSSLSYLSKLPVDNLKIDRSFIDDILHDTNDTAITLAIISLAQSLKLKVIAEGVENQDQRLFLQQCSCEYIQGFLVSPSKTDTAFMMFLREYNEHCNTR
ncbi:putative bifunctional diguanylate cyclase/phosphodiesterase [Alkalimarinus sediminis]|uniref:EAL domain-containing protein n=1 Tax=Alkalimarinus sediminis TaxID=1632866 RepID=A0A9E8HFN5_9ALTE|nr:EAL domain-containing protein [Alkalimarinus sediminis]UZW73337.1 EAL domain-containing protein [Alkalimarinus sediminis]